ncbi:MAG: triose-phosphate isomerase [Nitrospirota bacterium]|jgi:triosephosphate isomerase
MRKPFMAANWKMHKTVPEARAFVEEFAPLVTGAGEVDVVLAPSFTALYPVAELIKGTNIALSAQNVFYEEKGAYTGEVSPSMLRDLGCEYCIVGHSERRQYFGETDDVVNKKLRAAVAAGLKGIFCIGEPLEVRQAGKTNDLLKTQLTEGLRDVDLSRVVIAYEPVWAIGTGVTATPEQAQDAHSFIRGHVASLYDGALAENVRILYGGSVKPDNTASLMEAPDIDGALVGGASLKPDSFANIVKFKG